MPPRRNQRQPTTMFSLKQATDVIEQLANADGSKLIWSHSIATLVMYNEEGEGAAFTQLTKPEIIEHYADTNIMPLITDFDKVVDIIENQIMSSRSGSNIAIDTQKQYYIAIIRLTNPKSPCVIPKEVRDEYAKKLKEVEKITNDKRNLNAPQRANVLYPDFTWLKAIDEYNKFITETPFTNTKKGIKDLRAACCVGLYLLQRPRRVQDYANLQWFSKKPSEREFKDRNVLYADDDKLFLSIDVFKTRWRVEGNSNVKKEVLPTFIKEVNPRLASLFKDYIKKAKIHDMSKLSSAERRQGKNYYIFFMNEDEQDEPYTDNSFSKVLTACFKLVFKRAKLSVNTFRHMFNTYISENIQQFNDKQLQEIAIEVGDTAKNLPTNLRYRIADQNNVDMEKTQIEGQIQDNEYARNLMLAGIEEEGSVGNVAQDDVEEVASPPQQVPRTPTTDADLKTLYEMLGEARGRVMLLESLIAKKLGI